MAGQAAPAADARRMWSVTSIIALGLPKEALIGWAAGVVADRALDRRATLNAMREDGASRDELRKFLTDARWEKRNTAAFRGTELHRAAEALALGNPVPADLDDVALPYVEQYARFLEEHRPRFLMAEAPVYSLEWSYAGTLDAIVELDGLPFVLDAKTSDKGADARSTPPYPDIALQLVAYQRAEVVGLSPATMREFNRRRYYVYDATLDYAPMPQTAGGLALAIFPDRYDLVPVRLDDEVWEAFLAVRDVARWALETAPTVLGPPLVPAGTRDEQTTLDSQEAAA